MPPTRVKKPATNEFMTETTIHPSAYVADTVKLGLGISVGPFAVIEAGAEIGDHSVIQAHAVIHGSVRMGRQNHVFPHAVIGGLPQDIGFDPASPTFVEIGDGSVFREGVTVNRATAERMATRIGSGCYFMNNSHVAHDCSVGENTIFASGATIGGHCEVGSRVFMGGGVMVHQFCRIGSFAMVRGTSGVNKDIIPYMTVGGQPARHYKLNLIGLRRAGIDGARLKVLSAAMRRLKKREELGGLDETPELLHLLDWLAKQSKRGISNFVDVTTAE